MKSWLPLLCLLAAPLSAQAQDRSAMGDWRAVGRDSQNVYGWSAPGLREAAGMVVVQLVRVPLAAGTFDHEIVTLRIDCATDTYQVAFATRYDAAGHGPPMELIDQGPAPIGEGPLAAVRPLACGDGSDLPSRPPMSAAAFARQSRRAVADSGD